MANFHPIPPDCVDFLPSAAIELLDKACQRTPANILPLEEILARAKMGIGQIYIINDGHKLLGILYLMIFPNATGGVLNIPMMGAKNLMAWKDDLRNFVRKVVINNNIKDLCIITRPGWGKLFPELKESGTVYTASLVH